MPRDELDLSGILIDSRFRGECCIGRGGMGAVWRVRHVHTLQYFALKTIRADDPLNEMRLKRFLQEARVAAAIRSEHVVRVFDVRPDYIHEGKPLPYLVMELVDGGSLQDLLDARGRLFPGEVVWILRQVAAGLTCIHTSGVVHRDLKPSNVLLAQNADRELCVKLCDFGIAKCQASLADAHADADPDFAIFTTDSECLLGTPRYMAPEQLHQTVPVSPVTDQWALALIAFRALTGRDYFQHTHNGLRLALAIVNEDLAPPCSLSPVLPARFDAWFLRSCSREPKERFTSVQRQLEALEQALERPQVIPARLNNERDSTTDAPVAAYPRPTRARTRYSFHWVLLCACAALSLFASTWMSRYYAHRAPPRSQHEHAVQRGSAVMPTVADPNVSTSTSQLSDLANPLSSSQTTPASAQPAVSAVPRDRELTAQKRRHSERSKSENAIVGARLPRGAHCVRSSHCASGVCLAEACR